jgi:hypothetical protein
MASSSRWEMTGRNPCSTSLYAGRTPPTTSSRTSAVADGVRAAAGDRHTGAQRGAFPVAADDKRKEDCRERASGSHEKALQTPADFEAGRDRSLNIDRRTGYGAYGVPTVSSALSKLRSAAARERRMSPSENESEVEARSSQRLEASPGKEKRRGEFVTESEGDQPEQPRAKSVVVRCRRGQSSDSGDSRRRRERHRSPTPDARRRSRSSGDTSQERSEIRRPQSSRHSEVRIIEESDLSESRVQPRRRRSPSSDREREFKTGTKNAESHRSKEKSVISTRSVPRHHHHESPIDGDTERGRRHRAKPKSVPSQDKLKMDQSPRSAVSSESEDPKPRHRHHRNRSASSSLSDRGSSGRRRGRDGHRKQERRRRDDSGRRSETGAARHGKRSRSKPSDYDSEDSGEEDRRRNGRRRHRQGYHSCQRSEVEQTPRRKRSSRSKSASRSHKMKPGRFDGSQSLETFLAQFRTCASYNGWTEKDKSAFLKCSLSGGPAQLLWDSGDPDSLSFSQLVERLKSRYGSTGQAEKFRVELQSRRRRPGESLSELHADVRRLMALAYPDAYGNSVCEIIARDHFLSALGDRQLELKLREREPPDLDSALRLALRLEAYASSLKSEGEIRSTSPKQRRERDRYDDRLARRVSQIEQTLSQPVRQIFNAESSEWRRKYDDLVKEYEKLKLLDEQRRVAESTSTNTSKPAAKAKPKAADSEYRCYGCGETGHFRRSCPSNPPRPRRNIKPSTDSENKQPDDEALKVRGATSGSSECNNAFIRLRIEGASVDCLLDTGAEVTLIPFELARGCDIRPHDQLLRAANGTIIPIVGRAKLMAYAHSRYLEIDGLVTKHVPNVILGLEWMKCHAAVWDFESGRIRLGGQDFQLRSSSTRSWCRRVIAQTSTVVPPSTEMLLPVSIVYNGLEYRQLSSGDAWCTEIAEPKPGLRVSRTVIPERSSDVPVRVMNVTKQAITIEADEVVSDLQQVTPCSTMASFEEDISDEQAAVLRDLVNRVDEAVTDEIKGRLHDLLFEFRDTFSFSDYDNGRTSVLRHSIVTGDARPVRQTLRRHPPAHQAAIKEHVSTMLKQGVIEPAQSPWASNIVMVKKKDGSLRCCIDYRGLNAVTRKDAYPLPRTDSCLDAMNGAKWFTTFDLRNSYHQLELEPSDADKTAFICREGSFRFLTMPFGLCNAGATFQRLMDMVMAGLNFEICLVYMDDIVIFSKTLEQHVERLRLVLQRLREAGLKLKPSKCDVMRRSVEFLGHLVSDNGIEPHPDKVSAVTSWPVPTSLRDLRAFLGLCGYYRRFIDHFSLVAGPLYALTEKNRRYVWTPERQAAFDQLKQRLTSAPILCMPTDDDAFIIDTDASDSAIGAVLSQVSDGVERVVAYASKRLSRAEVNYCVTRRELLAVVYFLRYFRHFLLGRKFTVRTDHAALQWLRRIPQPVGQQARWLELLEEYDFAVVHRPGTRHGNADALSRRPCSKTRCCPVSTVVGDEGTCSVVYAVTTSHDASGQADPVDLWTAQAIADEQAADADVGPIRSLMIASTDCPPWDAVAHMSEASKSLWRQWPRLKVDNNILYRRFDKVSLSSKTVSWQVILPRGRRQQLINLVHSGVNGGHLGRRRTEAGVSRRAYWPAWTSDVRRFLQRCDLCAQYHRGKAPKIAPLKPLPSGEPWETISLDITGPHPRSCQGFTYILTVQDHFTKWAEAIPLRNHTAPVVASALFNHVLIRFGMPLRILSDQGAEFQSELFQELCRHMTIDKVRTSPYHPACNGMVERLHRTMNAMLAKAIDSNQRNWCRVLPGIMAAYRATPHEATGFSPNMLMFGHENRMPVDIILGSPSDDRLPRSTTAEYVAELQDDLREGYEVVRRHLCRAAERRKQQYDTSVKQSEINVGSWVWYFYPRRRVGLSAKWQRWYTGPYLVIRRIDSHCLVIQRSRRARPIVVHRDKLKPCQGEAPPSWLNGDRQPNEVAIEQTPAIVPLERDRATANYADDPTIPNDRSSRPRREGTLGARTRRRPQKYDDYVCHIFVPELAMQRAKAVAGGLRCRCCGTGFRKRRYLQRHLSDRLLRPKHDSFFDDPANRQQLSADAGIDWLSLSGQLERDCNPRQQSSSVRSIATIMHGALPVAMSRRWFQGPQGRHELEALVLSVVADSGCTDVVTAIEKLIAARPDISQDEAEIMALSAAAAAQFVSCVAAEYHDVATSSTRSSRAERRRLEADLNRWQAGLDDLTVTAGKPFTTVAEPPTRPPRLMYVPMKPKCFEVHTSKPMDTEEAEPSPPPSASSENAAVQPGHSTASDEPATASLWDSIASGNQVGQIMDLATIDELLGAPSFGADPFFR